MALNAENLKRVVLAPTNWFWNGLEDWLFFLSGPKPPVFQCPPQFEKKRLIQLLVFAVTTSGALGFVTSISVNGKWIDALSDTSVPIIVIVLAGGTLAVVYTFFTKLFRVPITINDAFYVFLFMSLPWLPSTALVFAVENVVDARAVKFLVLAWFTVTLIIVVVYICLGVYRVTNCSAWRCWASVVLPIILFIWLVIFLVNGPEIPFHPDSTMARPAATSSSGTRDPFLDQPC